MEITEEQKKSLLTAIQPSAAITVGTASIKILDVNTERKIVIISNDSAANVFLSLGTTAVINSGLRLNAGGSSFTFGEFTDTPYFGPVFAIAATTGNTLTIVEV